MVLFEVSSTFIILSYTADFFVIIYDDIPITTIDGGTVTAAFSIEFYSYVSSFLLFCIRRGGASKKTTVRILLDDNDGY